MHVAGRDWGQNSNSGYSVSGAASCSSRKALKPTSWTWAISSDVGPKVDCSRKRTVSGTGGCLAAPCAALTTERRQKVQTHREIQPKRQICFLIVTSPIEVWSMSSVTTIKLRWRDLRISNVSLQYGLPEVRRSRRTLPVNSFVTGG